MIVAELFAKLGLAPDESSFEKGHHLIEGVKLALEAYIGYEAIKKVYELVEGTEELALHAKKASQELGVSTDAIQELGYAAQMADLSQGEMETSLRKLSRSIQGLNSGSGESAKAFAQLGLSAKDFAGESVDQNLELIAERFKAMPDGAKKTALAMQLFGRSGAAMIPLLNKGKDGIADLRNEFVELGGELNEETIESFEELHHQQVRLGAVWLGIKNQIATALLPVFQRMVDSVMEWVKANKEAIQTSIETVVDVLSTAFTGLAYAVEAGIKVIGFFAEHSELAKAVIIALGLVLAAFAVEAAAAWLAATWPIIAVIAVVTLLVLAIMDVWKSIKTGHGFAADIWRRMKQAAQDFWGFISSIPGKIIDAFKAIPGAIKDAFGEAFDFVEAEADRLIKKLEDSKVGQLAKLVHLWPSGGGAPAGVSPTLPYLPTGGPSAVTVNQGDLNFTVNGDVDADNKAHWQQRAKELSDQLDARDEATRRKAAAALKGGAPP